MKLVDAVVRFGTKEGVSVTKEPKGFGSRYDFEEPSISREAWANLTPDQRLVSLFGWFRRMTVALKIDPEAADKALLEIDEYRDLMQQDESL